MTHSNVPRLNVVWRTLNSDLPGLEEKVRELREIVR